MSEETDTFAAHELMAWAKENMDVWLIDSYEKSWYSSSNHQNTCLKLLQHDHAFWLVVGSCAGGYGGDEDSWTTVNIGTVVNVSEVEPIFRAMSETAAIEYGQRSWQRKDDK